MRLFAGIAVAVVMSFTAVLAQQQMSDDDIKAALVGKRIDWSGTGTADYKANGDYEFSAARTWRGKYTIADGEVCVVFDDKSTRCDKIARDAKGISLTNKRGVQYYGTAR